MFVGGWDRVRVLNLHKYLKLEERIENPRAKGYNKSLGQKNQKSPFPNLQKIPNTKNI